MSQTAGLRDGKGIHVHLQVGTLILFLKCLKVFGVIIDYF